MINRFDAFVNKVLAESLQMGNISSIPKGMQGVGKTDSNTPPSSDPQITSAQTLPKAPEAATPKPEAEQTSPEDDEIKNEIGKLPPQTQQEIASAKNVEEIMTALSKGNIPPESKEKIETYIKDHMGGGENSPQS
jgi:hypothetical protein